MTRALAVALAVGVGGCFNPDLGDTPFRCGQGEDCPPGYRCANDNLCHKNGGADAPITSVDAPRVPDAPRPDARIIPLDAGMTCQTNTFQRCQDVSTALFCDGTGMNLVAVGCEAGCDMSHMQCNHCQPSTTLCSGDDLVTCSSGGMVVGTQHCVAGCDLGITPNACFVVAPPGFEDACRSAGGSDFTAVGDNTTFDTDACNGGKVVTQGPGPDICAFKFNDVLVPAGTNVRWVGSRVPVVIATGTAEVAGRLFVNGRTALPGPGAAGYASGNGASSSDADGAGGGGHATKGGDGGPMMGADHVVPAGGPAYPSTNDGFLLPGGAGGAGGSALGGGGGGALGLIACGVLTLDATAVIDAGGGGGPGAALVPTVTGGSGGGAGGTIRIDAAQVVFTSGTAIVSNGGGGGGGNGVSASGGMPGDDGHLDGTPAKGSAGAAGGCAGGAGGTSDGVTGALPMQGAPNTLATGGAGGGGGAAGVIVINTRPSASRVIPQGVVISPAPKVGEVARGH